MIRPKRLEKGDTICFLSVSGNIEDTDKVTSAKKYFKNKGYKVIISETTYKQNDYLAGSAEDRIKAFEQAFEDKNIDAILCTRGGYGAIQIINKLNYDIIKNNPKIFAGSSDISAFLTMINKKCDLITYHTPMPYKDFSGEINEFTQNSFFSTLEQTTKKYTAKNNFKTFYNGIASGKIIGGNLVTIATLAGNDFIPDEKFIFFAEEIDEPVYVIDRVFQQLLNIKKFKNNLSGIVLGEFTGTDNEQYLLNFFERLANKLQIPTCNGFEFGHVNKTLSLPVGENIVFDANNGTIEII